MNSEVIKSELRYAEGRPHDYSVPVIIAALLAINDRLDALERSLECEQKGTQPG